MNACEVTEINELHQKCYRLNKISEFVNYNYCFILYDHVYRKSVWVRTPAACYVLYRHCKKVIK